MTEIRTERLFLRPMQPEDSADLFAVFGNAEAMRYWSTLPHPRPEVTERMIAEIRGADPNVHLELAIEFEGRVIGKVGLWQMPEIGYILNPQYWRRGLAREAVHAVIDHGFTKLGLDRITANVDPDNLASLRMLAKLGFVEIGRATRTLQVGDQWFDSVYLLLRREDWTG